MDIMRDKKTDLTLEPSVNATEPVTLAQLSGISNQQELETISVGTVEESDLTEEEKLQVEQFAKQIDISNVDQIVQYGVAAQTNISAFSSDVLKRVKTNDLGEVGDSLKELTVALDDTTAPRRHGLLKIFQKAKNELNVVRANYNRAESNVERIEIDLRRHQEVLTQDISMYQQMFELNLQYYKELTMYILAGRKALLDARSGRLVELRERADATKKQEDAQAYKDFEDLCYRFEKKLSNLELTRLVSIQSAPQVRMLQNNDRELLDKIQSSLANTIPLWRNQLVISLGVSRTKRALDAQTALTDKTNELLLKNSENLKIATIETAKEVERPIVNLDTLQKCNRDLITSISEVVKIHEQGLIERREAQRELAKIEDELKQALLAAAY